MNGVSVNRLRGVDDFRDVEVTLHRRGGTEQHRAIAIIKRRHVTFAHGQTDHRHGLVAHAGDVKMALALSVQTFLAHVAMPALQHDLEQSPHGFGSGVMAHEIQ